MAHGGGILALDLATRTGWAAWTPGESAPRHGRRDLGRGRQLGSFIHGARMWLETLIQMERPAIVAYEAPILPQKTSQGAVRKLMGLVCEVEAACVGCRSEAVEVRASAARRFFTGDGGGKRAEVKARVIGQCRALGWQPASDDEADALAVLAYAAHQHGYPTPWTLTEAA